MGRERTDIKPERVQELREQGYGIKEMARKLGAHRSVIERRLHGRGGTYKKRRPSRRHFPNLSMKTYRHRDVTPQKLKWRLRELDDYTKRMALMEFVADVAETLTPDTREERASN